jgi:hypothetical protein
MVELFDQLSRFAVWKSILNVIVSASANTSTFHMHSEIVDIAIKVWLNCISWTIHRLNVLVSAGMNPALARTLVLGPRHFSTG